MPDRQLWEHSMAFDNRQRVTLGRRPRSARSGGRSGVLLASVAVVVLGVALVLGGAFGSDEGLRLGTALGSTTVPTPTTSTLAPDTSVPEVLATEAGNAAGSVTTSAVAATTAPSTTGAVPRAGAAPATTKAPVAAITQPPATSAPTTAKPPAPAPTSPTTAAPPTAAGNRVASVEADLLQLTNRDRSRAGVGSLTRNSCMDSAAAQWATHMAETGEMAHSSQSGSLVQGCRGANAYWGDNVGWWDPCGAGDMEDWWMGSPSHRSNILTSEFETIGIAVVPGVKGYCWFQVLFAS